MLRVLALAALAAGAASTSTFAQPAPAALEGSRDAGLSVAPSETDTDDHTEPAHSDAGPAAGTAVRAVPIFITIPVPISVPASKQDPEPQAPADDDPGAMASGQQSPTPTATAAEVIKAIVGLLVILVLACLAGHPRVRELEELLGLSHVITAGFPFVLLGLAAHHPNIGILSDHVLDQIRPVLPLGLGWIGFTIGFRFDARRLDTLPRGIGPALVLSSVLPFAGIVGACGLILWLDGGFGEGTFLRDAVILGIAGLIGVGAAGTTPDKSAEDGLAPIIRLQEGCAIIGLVVLHAFWRPAGTAVGWQLPAVPWVFITLGMGTALGVVIYAVLNSVKNTAEITLVMLGGICLAAGLASFLRLSPIAVCFLAGALIFNFPGTWKEQVRLALNQLERPVYLVFLVIAGALWSPGAWQGWVLLLLFVAARLGGKVLAVFLFRKQKRLGALSRDEETRIAMAPVGALAIAIVVNAQDLYSGPTVSWLVTAIMGGAIATEIVVQIAMRRIRPKSQMPPVVAIPSPSGLAPPPRTASELPSPDTEDGDDP